MVFDTFEDFEFHISKTGNTILESWEDDETFYVLSKFKDTDKYIILNCVAANEEDAIPENIQESIFTLKSAQKLNELFVKHSWVE